MDLDGLWRPIETAPKDLCGGPFPRTSILLYDKKKGGVSIGEWCWWLGRGGAWHRSLGGARLNPTHWMPLPKDPV